jgi:poly(A) polymerase
VVDMEQIIISRDHHKVSRKQMPQEVLKVLYRLHRTGHVAYLCGGGVRDLLLGRKAGDFDVATDAHPRRLKQIFGNCRLVGRRFRIAHILFKGGKIIEVSTFRKEADEEAPEARESLLIKRDNTFGTPAEDAFRRDFTVNALYYNIADFTVIDYVGGRADLQSRLIRSIGNPEIRFQEDPIRILRGIRLAAFLDFQVEDQTWEAMVRRRLHLLECAPSRAREEIMKILRRGNTHPAFQMLARGGILELLFPELQEFLNLDRMTDGRSSTEMFWQYLTLLDGLRSGEECFSDALLLAILTAAPAISSLETLPAGHDVGKWLHGYLEGYFKPLAFPRMVRSQTLLLLLALRQKLTPGRPRRRKILRDNPLFDDALKLFDIHRRVANQDRPVLDAPPRSQRRLSRSSRSPATERTS